MNEGSKREVVKGCDYRRQPKLWQYVIGAVASALLLLGAAIPAGAAELMRVTFIRHGESYGNTSGRITVSPLSTTARIAVCSIFRDERDNVSAGPLQRATFQVTGPPR